MKLEWGKKISCPGCAMPLYDLMRSTIVCPHCGMSFEEGELKLRKKNNISDDNAKNVTDFEFDSDLETDDTTVLEGDDMDNDIGVLKIKEFE